MQPLIERVTIKRYLNDIELVIAGGESDYRGRALDFDWVLSIRDECRETGTSFQFRQCGTNFIKDGKRYKLKRNQLCSQARKAGIDINNNIKGN